MPNVKCSSRNCTPGAPRAVYRLGEKLTSQPVLCIYALALVLKKAYNTVCNRCFHLALGELQLHFVLFDKLTEHLRVFRGLRVKPEFLRRLVLEDPLKGADQVVYALAGQHRVPADLKQGVNIHQDARVPLLLVIQLRYTEVY